MSLASRELRLYFSNFPLSSIHAGSHRWRPRTAERPQADLPGSGRCFPSGQYKASGASEFVRCAICDGSPRDGWPRVPKRCDIAHVCSFRCCAERAVVPDEIAKARLWRPGLGTIAEFVPAPHHADDGVGLPVTVQQEPSTGGGFHRGEERMPDHLTPIDRSSRPCRIHSTNSGPRL